MRLRRTWHYYRPLVAVAVLLAVFTGFLITFTGLERSISSLLAYRILGLISLVSLLWTILFFFGFLSSLSNFRDDVADIIALDAYAVADADRLRPFILRRIRAKTGHAAISIIGLIIGFTALVDGHLPRFSRAIGDEVLLGLLAIACILSVTNMLDQRERRREDRALFAAVASARKAHRKLPRRGER